MSPSDASDAECPGEDGSSDEDADPEEESGEEGEGAEAPPEAAPSDVLATALGALRARLGLGTDQAEGPDDSAADDENSGEGTDS